MAVPLTVSWFVQDGVWQAWPAAMLTTMVVGLLLWLLMRQHKQELHPVTV